MTVIEGNAAQQPLPMTALQQPTIAAEEPSRQPSGPPTVNKAQKDAGFASFLKKHSSPTHSRVTAGGRIVPMEKRDSPPKFDLAGSQHSSQTVRGAVTEEKLLSSPLGHNEGTDNYFSIQPRCHHVEESPHPQSVAPDLQDVSTVQKDILSPSNDNQTPTLLNSKPFEPSYGVGQLPFAVNYPIMPQPTFPPLVPISPMGWQYPTLPSASASTQDIFDGVEPTTRLLVSSQNCLAQAELHFGSLDCQLKAIDRHRAMSHHDPSLAAQRYAIVERRSEAKELVTRLVAQVEALQSLKGPLVDTTTGSGLMGSAQPFVPQTTTPLSPASSRPQTAGGSVDMATEADYSVVEKQPTTSKRKIIPIVAPPEKASRSTGQVISHRSDPLSSQGMRSASRDDRLAPSAGTMNHGTVRRRLHPQMEGHVEPQRAASTTCVQSSTDSETPHIIRWADGKPGSLPAGLEAWTDLYYDALRLPEGVITVFLLDNDVCFEVCGARIKCPAAADLNAAEREYWQKRPIFTKAMLDELRSKAEIINDSDYGDEYLLGHTLHQAADGTAKLDDVGSINSDEGGVRLHASVNMQDILEEAVKFEAGRRQHAASAPQPVAPAVSSDENQVDGELSNKGYSSVIVQTINATVQLPTSFDGTTENKARNAKAVLKAAKNNRSPRIQHRSTPQGGA